MSLQINDNTYSTDGGITWQPIERGTPQPLPEDDLMIPRAVVADALADLRADWVRQKIEPADYPDQQGHNSLVGCFIDDLDATIAALGLAPGKEGSNGLFD